MQEESWDMQPHLLHSARVYFLPFLCFLFPSIQSNQNVVSPDCRLGCKPAGLDVPPEKAELIPLHSHTTLQIFHSSSPRNSKTACGEM